MLTPEQRALTVVAATHLGPVDRQVLGERIAAAVREAIAAEREACARVAEEASIKLPPAGATYPFDWLHAGIAAAIRARP